MCHSFTLAYGRSFRRYHAADMLFQRLIEYTGTRTPSLCGKVCIVRNHQCASCLRHHHCGHRWLGHRSSCSPNILEILGEFHSTGQGLRYRKSLARSSCRGQGQIFLEFFLESWGICDQESEEPYRASDPSGRVVSWRISSTKWLIFTKQGIN